MMTQAHKYFLAGLVVGVIALWVWHRRSGGSGGAPEGG